MLIQLGEAFLGLIDMAPKRHPGAHRPPHIVTAGSHGVYVRVYRQADVGAHSAESKLAVACMQSHDGEDVEAVIAELVEGVLLLVEVGAIGVDREEAGHAGDC